MLRSLSVVAVMAALVLPRPAAGADLPLRTIAVDARHVAGPFEPMATLSVGAGRAAELLRADVQAQLREVAQECGFRYVRFHGIFHDEMNLFPRGAKPGVYNFQYVDQVYDAILAAGMKPFVEFGFMPTALASGDKTVFWWKGNVTPPKSSEAWGDLITAFTRHLIARYGADEVRSWWFEVWNEPNHPAFFAGTQDEYFTLYATTARALKAVDPALRVGGPATAGNAWVKELIAYTEAQQVPLDFVSTHTYGVASHLDEFGKKQHWLKPAERPIADDVARIRAQVRASPRPDLPLHYTEWSASSSSRDPVHDAYFSAAYILSNVHGALGHADSLSYWTFSDIFEEAGPPPSPFHGGFGLLNTQGLRKPAFFAYQFLHRLGSERLTVADSRVLATRRSDDVQVILWDYTQPAQDAPNNTYFTRDLPAAPVATAEVQVSGLAPGTYTIATYSVGYRRNDVYTAYLDLGAPANLLPDQRRTLADQTRGAPQEERTATVGPEGLRLRFPLRQNDVWQVLIRRQP